MIMFIFQGDLYLWVKLLIPGVVKRIYNMQNKQLIKIFSRYTHLGCPLPHVRGIRRTELYINIILFGKGTRNYNVFNKSWIDIYVYMYT